jgi:Mg-chelatase subunit ChlD
MKKLTATTFAGLLTLALALAGEPSAADHKWLEAVGKLISDGQTRVATPIQERVTLAKEWAAKNGYSVQVTKKDNSFQIDFAKNLARK